MPRLRTLAALAVVGACVLSFTVKSHGQAVNRDEILQLATNAAPGKNLTAGRALFEKNCATCHRFGPMGTDVGPDLTTINSRFKKRDILEAILFPSKLVSDQYQSEIIKTATASHNALVVRETAAAVQVRVNTDPGKPIVIQKSAITSREKSEVSFMTEGLIDKTSQADIANLMAFIQAGPPKTSPAPISPIR